MRSKPPSYHQPQSQPLITTAATDNNENAYRSRQAHYHSISNIISSVRRFLNFHHHHRQHKNIQSPYYAHSQQSRLYGSPESNPSTDDVKLPLFKLCNFGVWQDTELGRGYSGVVHRGVGILLNEKENDVEDSRPMALKLSKPRNTHFNHEAFGTPGREFETLKLLYMNGIPVPRPLGFCISADDTGNGRTLLIMELIDGLTLREWINSQTDLVLRHNSTGRTLHPAKTIDAAIERLDIVIGLVEALQKLHRFGVFVDLKPRNIMIGRQKVWDEGTGESVRYEGENDGTQQTSYQVTLVDIGGVVLRKDIKKCWNKETVDNGLMRSVPSLDNSKMDSDSEHKENTEWHSNIQRDEIPGTSSIADCLNSFTDDESNTEELKNDKNLKHFPTDETTEKELGFNPKHHRRLLETTCSYLSPELAAIIVESDREKELLINHFHPSLPERLAFHDSEMKGKIATIKEDRKQNYDEEKSRWKNEEDELSDDKASWLTKTWRQSRTKITHTTLRNRLKLKILSKNYEKALAEMKRQNIVKIKKEENIIFLGQKSSVFSLGLILVELFGGLRTGLTALCHIPMTRNWFSKNYAFDLFEREYNNKLCCKTENLINNKEGLIASLTPYSGSSHRAVDIEFRIALGWETQMIPVSSASIISLDVLRGESRTEDDEREKSFIAPTPSTAAHTTEDNSTNEYQRNYKWNKINENEINNLTNGILMRSFKELYKQHCYPFEGCLSASWVYKHNSYDGRIFELPVGQVSDLILNNCLEYDPIKRPSYAILKRMIHGLKLILWNLKNDRIFDKWKNKSINIINIQSHIDNYGYIEMNGTINDKRVTILRTISRQLRDRRFQLVLEINFD